MGSYPPFVWTRRSSTGRRRCRLVPKRRFWCRNMEVVVEEEFSFEFISIIPPPPGGMAKVFGRENRWVEVDAWLNTGREFMEVKSE